jgi:pilus assembly protein CpaE
MKLFGDTNSDSDDKKGDLDKERIEGKISRYKVAIVSTNTTLVEKIRSILVLYNIVRIQVFDVDFADLREKVKLDEFDVVLIDIGRNTDVEFISAYLTQYIPVDCIAYVVGNNDSISFAYELEKKGIKYLLNNIQLDNLPMLLWEGKNKESKRQGNIITFLGCKGGVGTSYLAYNTVRGIYSLSKIPMLFVQGASGSSDIDFIVEEPVEKDGSIVQLKNNISVRIEPVETAWNYKDDSTSKFNLIVFDHNLNNNLSVSQMNNVFLSSNSVILVINRDPYSIKVAKSIIEERGRIIARDESIADKRFFICLNDNHPFNKKEMLSDEDIEEFLERKIDLKQRYYPSPKRLKDGDTSKDIRTIATLLIGIDGHSSRHSEQVDNKDKKSLLSFIKLRKDNDE